MMANMKYSLLICLFFLSTSHADIYRSVDKDGNVTYTDEPNSQAEKIELEELPTYEAPSIPAIPSIASPNEEQPDSSDTLAVPKYSVSVTSPEQNQSIWAGGGIIEVVASVSPALSEQRGDKLQFKLDGKNVGEPRSGTSYTLDNVERGSHILAVSVVNKQNKVLSTSKSVLFHLHRKSVAQ